MDEATSCTGDSDDVTDDRLMGGRIRYAQPTHGFRSGIEPVLLAASVPAKPGQRVLEGGSGAGAALLCLAFRISGLKGVGIEQDERLVSLAAKNAAANDWPALRFIAADIAAVPDIGAFDHACANPPYHLASGTASPDASRQVAKGASAGLLAIWASALTKCLKPRGTLTFILPDDQIPTAIAAFAAAGNTPTAILPLWPRSGRPAKLVLLRGVKAGRSPFRIHPGLTLHQADGAFTSEADEILRNGALLKL